MAKPQLPTRTGKAATTNLINRQRGIFKKSNTLRRMYGGEVAVLIKQQDGRVVTYESKPGMLNNAGFLFPDISYGPDDFDTIKDRQCTPVLSPTTISLMTTQFFDAGGMIEAPSIGDTNDGSMVSSSVTPSGDASLFQASAANDEDPCQDALGPSTSGLFNVDQEQYFVGDSDTRETFFVPKDYVFPSSLLLKPYEEVESCGFSSSSSLSSSSVSLPTSPEWDGAEQESDSIESAQPISPQSQDDILSLINEYTKD
ncbi:hypothetical protein F5B17DRAFT_425358 [Nemania serpens]|nr:hypothetical protein F5B17DRAFT_425358 [Nemania serpens]